MFLPGAATKFTRLSTEFKALKKSLKSLQQALKPDFAGPHHLCNARPDFMAMVRAISESAHLDAHTSHDPASAKQQTLSL